jgi:hypothetical protein
MKGHGISSKSRRAEPGGVPCVNQVNIVWPQKAQNKCVNQMLRGLSGVGNVAKVVRHSGRV